MIQFYFLSVFLNAAAGLALASRNDGATTGPLAGLRAFLSGDAPRLIVGSLSVVTAVFKFLTPVEGDVPVIGDLAPALAGLLSGVALLLDYYRSKSDVASPGLERVFKLILGRRRALGVAALAAAALHFVFPRIVLL